MMENATPAWRQPVIYAIQFMRHHDTTFKKPAIVVIDAMLGHEFILSASSDAKVGVKMVAWTRGGR